MQFLEDQLQWDYVECYLETKLYGLNPNKFGLFEGSFSGGGRGGGGSILGGSITSERLEDFQ